MIGLGVAGYQFHEFQSNDVPRMENEIAKLEADVSQKQAEIRTLQEFAMNIENIKLELRELNVQLEAALEHMPRGYNLSGLLRKLTMIAQNSGIDLASFKPKRSEERGEGAFYSTILIDCDLRGTFTQTLVFLDQVSRLKRIVNVETLKFKPAEGAPQRSGAIVTQTQVSLRTYRFAE